MDAIEHLGGDMFADKALIEHEKEEDKKNGTAVRDDREIRLCIKEKMMAVALVKRSKTENKKLIQKIRDQHAFVINVYPKNYMMLTNYFATSLFLYHCYQLQRLLFLCVC